jgi:hypothetical protein
MSKSPIWITGGSRCGKTTRLKEKFIQWLQTSSEKSSQNIIQKQVLVFAANDENRRELADELSTCTEKSYPIMAKTPLGFISDEVKLFFPLLKPQLNLKSQIPIRLRPETEQELATKLWRPQFNAEDLLLFGGEYRFVRRILDLLQLAGAAGIAPENIPDLLQAGLKNNFAMETNQNELWQRIGDLLLKWRQWCLDKGLLSYSLIYELYWRYLLPNSTYQQKLTSRYQAIFADDTDDYPAISADLFNFLLDRGFFGVFSYNPHGKVRLGLNADPNYLKNLASRCQIETLEFPPVKNVASEIADRVINLITDPLLVKENISNNMGLLSATSRAELLRQTAELIIKLVNKGEVKPGEIAVIAPGLDDIARYTLIDILQNQGIPIEPLNEQQPLISSPIIRALLTLLGLVYQGLGQFVWQDALAEMLVVLSQKYQQGKLIPQIDPVRAGLLADYCYHIDLELPCLLPVETFTRWDRLGHQTVEAYNDIWQWIEAIKNKQKQEANFTPMVFFDRAIQKFFPNGSHLSYSQLASLRELTETAQHFWEVDNRLKKDQDYSKSSTQVIREFIQLLQRGTITANPYPLKPAYTSANGEKMKGYVTLATIYQYRSLRSHHRWQFWLDVGSNLWSKGGSAELLAAPLFLKEWTGNSWTAEDQFKADQERLERILRDLLARTSEKVYLCHSELNINGTEDNGILLTLVHSTSSLDY